jgi:mannosyltransferase OCH1-like enzyme
MQLPKHIPKEIKDAHASWHTMNPLYVVKYYSGSDCERYLLRHFGKLHTDAFRRIQAYSGKCDFFRYCVLFNEGGYYTDWKQVCLKPIDEYVPHKTKLMTFHDQGNAYSIKHKLFQSSFTGSVKQHPALKKAIDICLKHVANKHYGISPLDPLAMTVFTKALNDTGSLMYNVLGSFKQDPRNKPLLNFYLHDHTAVVQHKARNSGYGQDWTAGNNYNELWQQKKFYR